MLEGISPNYIGRLMLDTCLSEVLESLESNKKYVNRQLGDPNMKKHHDRLRGILQKIKKCDRMSAKGEDCAELEREVADELADFSKEVIEPKSMASSDG